MRVHTTEMLARWLADVQSGSGVNAYARKVPVLDGHARPREIKLVTTPYRLDADGERCAEWKEPRAYPALYVNPDGPVGAEGEVGTINRDAPSLAIAVRLLLEGGESNVARQLESEYLLRAIVQSVCDFNGETAEARAARQLNSIEVRLCNAITFGTWAEAVGDAKAVAVVGCDFYVRDHAP